MGLFLHAVLFPGGEEERCRQALGRCAADPLLGLRPAECRWRQCARGPAALLNDGFTGPELLAARMSFGLEDPLMVLFIYDGDFWGYFLWQKGAELDRFASQPDYFSPGNPPAEAGDARAVGRVFSKTPALLQNYLAPWRPEKAGRRAYAGDGAPAGDCWQMADFMGALGFDYNSFQMERPAEGAVFPEDKPPKLEYQQEDWLRRGPAEPEDTPELPNALNDREYAWTRARLLGPAGEELRGLLKEGCYQQGVDWLTKALQTQPEEPSLYLLRAFCWAQMEGSGQGRSRKPEMDRDLTQALEQEPDNVWILRARCPTAATSARYRRHIQDLTRLIELDPENQDIYLVSRAYRLHWSGNDDGARQDLELVLDHGNLWTVDLTYLCNQLRLGL